MVLKAGAEGLGIGEMWIEIFWINPDRMTSVIKFPHFPFSLPFSTSTSSDRGVSLRPIWLLGRWRRAPGGREETGPLQTILIERGSLQGSDEHRLEAVDNRRQRDDQGRDRNNP